jgi:putative spermidine/putrescine transport system permease protein
MAVSASLGNFGRAVRGRRRAWTGAPALLLLLPALVLLVAFFLVPYVNMLVMSFRVPSTSQPYAPGFTIENYVEALTDLYYLRILWDTAVFGVLTTYACVLSPLLVGVVIRCYGWIILLANNGLINDSLKKLGLVETFAPLMYNEFGVAVGLIHVFLPFMILPILGSIQSIDPALEEAAQSLGASRLMTMRRIVLPLSLPGIQAGTILVFVLTISSYVIPILLGGYKVMLMSTLVVQQLLDAFLWPFGAALALILSVAGAAAIYGYLRLTGRLMRGIA